MLKRICQKFIFPVPQTNGSKKPVLRKKMWIQNTGSVQIVPQQLYLAENQIARRALAYYWSC
jgi:hypothetical protein